MEGEQRVDGLVGHRFRALATCAQSGEAGLAVLVFGHQDDDCTRRIRRQFAYFKMCGQPLPSQPGDGLVELPLGNAWRQPGGQRESSDTR